jgi:hypothetical protein
MIGKSDGEHRESAYLMPLWEPFSPLLSYIFNAAFLPFALAGQIAAGLGLVQEYNPLFL